MAILQPDAFMPRPQLALNIGITGHRPNKLGDSGAQMMAAQFRSIADEIEAQVTMIRQEPSAGLYCAGPPLLRIVSGLAEGADRIAVLNAPANWLCEAVLPMPRAEYAKDFGADPAAPARLEFQHLLTRAVTITELTVPGLEGDDARTASYRQLGTFLLGQIDLLIAVWDGGPADGPGGTGELVIAALQTGMPVVWIDPRSPGPARLLRVVGRAGAPHETAELNPQTLGEHLRAILLPQIKPVQHHAAVHAPPASPDAPLWLHTPWPSRLLVPFAYMLLRKITHAGRWSWPIRYPAMQAQMRGWSPFFNAMQADPATSLQQSLTDILLPRSLWADTLAWKFGNIYRSAYITSFFLAGLSVPLGLCYLFFLFSPSVLGIKAGFVVLELIIISTVVIVIRRGVRSDWHGQWLQTRELSELLRSSRHLAYVGGLRSFLGRPSGVASESLPGWYARATFREIGLVDAVLDDTRLRAVLAGTCATEISEQRAYHAANAANLTRVHHWLHRAGDLCFAATIGFLLVYLAAWVLDWIVLIAHAQAFEAASGEAALAEGGHSWFHEWLEYGIKPVVSIAAAGLPALGAALAGIREQGDFKGFAERSSATDQQLALVEARIQTLLARPNPIDIATATDALASATQVMARDVSAWQQLYANKHLTLPA